MKCPGPSGIWFVQGVLARGQGGERQVPRNDFVLVSANGGILNFHSTIILSPHASGH
jgi:hypothetical protein